MDGKVMHVRSAIVAAGLLFLSAWSGAKKTSSLTDLSKACKPGSQLQITEAYFTHGGNDDVCTHSTSCKPTDAGDPSAPCFLDQEENVCRPKFRFSLQDLNRVYDAVDTGATALKELRDEFLTHGHKYRIRYFCVDGRRDAVNPCRGHGDGAIKGSFTSIIIHPDRANPNRSHQACHRVCRLTPLSHFRLTSNILLKDNTATKNNFVQYQYVYEDLNKSSCKRLDESYFTTKNTSQYRTTLNIRLSFSDLATVTRLWLSMQGTKFQLFCTTEEKAASILGMQCPISSLATTLTSRLTTSPSHKPAFAGLIAMYSCMMPVGAGLAVVGISVFLLLQ